MDKLRMRPEEVVRIITTRINAYRQDVQEQEYGTVVQVGDSIARVYGLPGAKSGELLDFGNNVFGIALNLEQNSIGCIILGSDNLINEGTIVRPTGKVAMIPVGAGLPGRIINPLGSPLDDLGPISFETVMPIERIAPGVVDRQPVKQSLQTGIKAIDSMIPIGKGQRELIIGDRKTGKTAIAIDTIINQVDKNVICIYVAIGKKESTVAQVVRSLADADALKYTIIVNAGASDPAALQYIAPYAGCAVAEFFMDKGRDVLIVYDDLSAHAKAYRQISLLLRRPPGREAYPGDVFYIHSRLLERALKYSAEKGSGSLTALPIIETLAGDITAYIPTNLISITDGQIYLKPELFNSGIRPAVDVGLSVSRVGGSAQVRAMKKVAASLRLDMAQYKDVEAFSQFGGELDKATADQLEKGKRLVEVFKQAQYKPMKTAEQVIVLYVAVNNMLGDIEIASISRFESGLLDFIRSNYMQLIASLETKNDFDDNDKDLIAQIVTEYKEFFKVA